MASGRNDAAIAEALESMAGVTVQALQALAESQATAQASAQAATQAAQIAAQVVAQATS